MPLEQVSENKSFGGLLRKYKFKSSSLGGLYTNFNIFLPIESKSGKVPLLIYLAGLTCNEDTGAQKGGFIGNAASHGIAILFPDTSPRGADVSGEDDDWDFGTGAGFYLNATNPKFSKHYNMFDLITNELQEVLENANLPINLEKKAIFGHSMGGHGALTLYLSGLSTKRYLSASAFAPICNPTKVPWGEKAFKGYLAGGIEEGKQKYDATELISNLSEPLHILIDYGTADNFGHQLSPDAFVEAARAAGHGESEVKVRSQDGYDHSYYFISTFAEEHIRFHASLLNA